MIEVILKEKEFLLLNKGLGGPHRSEGPKGR